MRQFLSLWLLLVQLLSRTKHHFNMGSLTMREELTVLTLVFIFCIVTIPIVIFSSKEYQNKLYAVKHPFVEPVITNFYQMNFRDRAVTSSVKIIEDHNRNPNRTEKISVNIFMNVDSFEFEYRFYQILPRLRYLPRTQQDEIARIWKLFKFQNGTVLLSNSTMIPLKVDW